LSKSPTLEVSMSLQTERYQRITQTNFVEFYAPMQGDMETLLVVLTEIAVASDGTHQRRRR